MTEHMADVIVIGAGLAGLAIANRVAEAGLSVTVLEKSPDEAYLCNSRYTGGLFHIAMEDMAGAPDWVRGNLHRTTRGTTDPALADVKLELIVRLGSFLESDARWTCYWHTFRLDQFEQLGRPGGDFQMYRPH